MLRTLTLHGTSKVLGDGEAQLMLVERQIVLVLTTSRILPQEDLSIIFNHWSADFACTMFFDNRRDEVGLFTYIWRRNLPFSITPHTLVNTWVRTDVT